MSFIEKLNKIKLVVIVSIVIFCLAFGGMAMAKYVDSSKVKEGISLGNKYLEEQKYEEAIIAFQKVIEIEPKNIEARVRLSKAYVNTGRNDEAEDVLKEAMDINPKRVEPYLELSKLYINKNDLINSIKILTDGYKATNDESIKSMLEDIKSKITTDDINTTVKVGEDYSLPKEVTLKIDNNEVQFPVNWDATEVDTTKVGTTTFNGTLENTDKTFKLTLNVITITSIEDINNKIKQNDNYSLPSKVTATMTDNSKRDVEVTWNPSSIDTSKAGNYSYQGTVSGYNSKVKLTLNIESAEKDIESVANNNEISANEATNVKEYNSGDIAELSGTMKKVDWERPNGEKMTSYVLELDTPANFNIPASYQTQYQTHNVNEIQICGTADASQKVNQHVNIRGVIRDYPGTPYYLAMVTIFDGNFY